MPSEGTRQERFAAQVDAIAASWCADEGHDWIRLRSGDNGPSAPVVFDGAEVPVRWCRNCGLTERVPDAN